VTPARAHLGHASNRLKRSLVAEGGTSSATAPGTGRAWRSRCSAPCRATASATPWSRACNHAGSRDCFDNFGKGDDRVGPLRSRLSRFELCELVILLKLDEQFPDSVSVHSSSAASSIESTNSNARNSTCCDDYHYEYAQCAMVYRSAGHRISRGTNVYNEPILYVVNAGMFDECNDKL
jgi:hypothetical protein